MPGNNDIEFQSIMLYNDMDHGPLVDNDELESELYCRYCSAARLDMRGIALSGFKMALKDKTLIVTPKHYTNYGWLCEIRDSTVESTVGFSVIQGSYLPRRNQPVTTDLDLADKKCVIGRLLEQGCRGGAEFVYRKNRPIGILAPEIVCMNAYLITRRVLPATKDGGFSSEFGTYSINGRLYRVSDEIIMTKSTIASLTTTSN